MNQQSLFLNLQSNQDFIAAIQANDLAAAKASTRLAGEASALANSAKASTAESQVIAQISLALGSAFFGAIFGWIITKWFDVMRPRRRSPGRRPGSPPNERNT